MLISIAADLSVKANRMWVSKTLPQEVAILVFDPKGLQFVLFTPESPLPFQSTIIHGKYNIVHFCLQSYQRLAKLSGVTLQESGKLGFLIAFVTLTLHTVLENCSAISEVS